MNTPRRVVWFSCGAASAVAAQKTLELYPEAVLVYCDTMSSEHPDNARFLANVEDWLGIKVHVISSEKYASVDEVIEKRRYMAGPGGALCTVELKKIPRFKWQRPSDIHIFGYTADESKRADRFVTNNPELNLEWPLISQGITKFKCMQIIQAAGIELPVMYGLGYRNNNCIGCVKATSPKYWNLVRQTHPEVFSKRVSQSAELGVKLVQFKGKRIMLGDMPDADYSQMRLPSISCGPECAPP